MGFNPLDLEALYLAAAKGFGTLDLDKVHVTGRPPESVQRNFIKSRGGSGRGFFYGRGIRRWLVAGPFPGDLLDAAEHLPEEAGLRPLEGQIAGASTWGKVEHLGYSAEVLDLAAINDQQSGVSSYSFALVHSDQPQDGFLWLGYDERIRVWLNGEVVFEDPSRRAFALADLKIPVHLEEGENRLLFKVGNVSGPTSLAAHVVDEDGDRLFGIRFALPGDVFTAVEETLSADALPSRPVLMGNYPNPFNPATFIRFGLPHRGAIELAVYDLAGQRIRTLLRGEFEAGYHEAVWDGRDASGFNAASGVYLALLSGADFRESRPMLLLR